MWFGNVIQLLRTLNCCCLLWIWKKDGSQMERTRYGRAYTVRIANRTARGTFSNWFQSNERTTEVLAESTKTKHKASRTNETESTNSQAECQCGMWMPMCGCCVFQCQNVPAADKRTVVAVDLQLILASQLDNNLYLARCAHLNVFTYCLSHSKNPLTLTLSLSFSLSLSIYLLLLLSGCVCVTFLIT